MGGVFFCFQSIRISAGSILVSERSMGGLKNSDFNMSMEEDPQKNLYTMMRPHPVCICRGVSRERLLKEIREGADTFEELQKRTRCSTGCGTCEPKVREILKGAT